MDLSWKLNFKNTDVENLTCSANYSYLVNGELVNNGRIVEHMSRAIAIAKAKEAAAAKKKAKDEGTVVKQLTLDDKYKEFVEAIEAAWIFSRKPEDRIGDQRQIFKDWESNSKQKNPGKKYKIYNNMKSFYENAFRNLLTQKENIDTNIASLIEGRDYALAYINRDAQLNQDFINFKNNKSNFYYDYFISDLIFEGDDFYANFPANKGAIIERYNNLYKIITDTNRIYTEKKDLLKELDNVKTMLLSKFPKNKFKSEDYELYSE